MHTTEQAIGPPLLISAIMFSRPDTCNSIGSAVHPTACLNAAVKTNYNQKLNASKSKICCGVVVGDGSTNISVKPEHALRNLGKRCHTGNGTFVAINNHAQKRQAVEAVVV